MRRGISAFFIIFFILGCIPALSENTDLDISGSIVENRDQSNPEEMNEQPIIVNQKLVNANVWPREYIGCFCPMAGGINAPLFLAIYIPPFFYYVSTSDGGYLTALCFTGPVSWNCSQMDLIIVGFIGAFLPPLTPTVVQIGKRAFGGFAGCIYVYCNQVPNRDLIPNQGTPGDLADARGPDQAEISSKAIGKPTVLQNKQIVYFGQMDMTYSLQPVEGGYFMTASSFNPSDSLNYIWLIKANETGTKIWSKIYGGERNDNAFDGRPSFDGGYIVTSSKFIDSTKKDDIWLLKANSMGDSVWENTYDLNGYDKAAAIAETIDSGYVVTGFTSNDSTSSCFLMKVSENGVKKWVQNYYQGSALMGKKVKSTRDSGFIILCNATGSSPQDLNAVLIKTDSVGNEKWRKLYGGDGLEFGTSVIETYDSGYAFIGFKSTFGERKTDFWLVKTNSLGEQQWSKTYGNLNYDVGMALIQTDDDNDNKADDGYLLTGYTIPTGSTYPDLWLVKVDPMGDIQWDDTKGGSGPDAGTTLWQNSTNGNYVVTGYTGDSVHQKAWYLEYTFQCQGRCGDANMDNAVNVADAVWMINYVFAGGLPPKPVMACGDANADGASNVSDAVWIINYVFAGGGPPTDCKPAAWVDKCCHF